MLGQSEAFGTEVTLAEMDYGGLLLLVYLCDVISCLMPLPETAAILPSWLLYHEGLLSLESVNQNPSSLSVLQPGVCHSDRRSS